MSTTDKPMILIIDDDPDFHNSMVFSFTEYNFISTYEETAAMAVAEGVSLDLILSDLNFDKRKENFKRGTTLIKQLSTKNIICRKLIAFSF